ncbi:AMP-binding enzyme family protein (macronuclear) [Tetrahymena thermophila SB210]|uniref:AMP-binding enzyme family protein n=1 Tax=Tetrahymena thermophila (strain SB210) TaxID=312017 RepID=Q23JL2_TETTS|nr:AMP-binding enzyme family protein [Tetrahymena thermophila SB210]EAR96731.1 AMP-binding enzyme family protein [Tetrahymena thermophila SB210]|eukprot:XP_001016976.1 AMP-binding enzyme family protein [Tetrahymena thermophila SB210]
MQYFGNKIDPIFRSQSFVTNDLIEIPLHEDLVAFQFIESPKQTLEQFQKKMNLTYIVPIATFGFESIYGYNTTYLNFTECSNPELQGYHCLDFSSLSNKSLIQSSRDKAFSVITILFYSCSVTDNIKTFVPDNCANQTDVDDFVNGAYTLLHLRLFTQQYNTTSKQNQVNFKNYMMFPQSDQYFLNTQKTQNQITKVRDGFVIQSETEYTAPIQYVQENQSFPNDQNPYIQVNIQIDEVIQYTSIQFSTFPQILALVNSTFSLLILFGFFCRKFANKSILQDFFCVFLQNMHQNLYEEVLKQNKLFEQKSLSTEIETKLTIGQETAEKDAVNSINIPQFITKSREDIEQSQQIQFNTDLQNYQDEIIQPNEEQKSTIEDQSPNQNKDSLQQKTEQLPSNENNKEDNQFNNILLTSGSNENKNSNDSYLNIFKKSPKSQLNLFKSNFSQAKAQRPLIKLPSQSCNNFKKLERKSSSFILQKDIALCFSQNIQQPTNNQQDQQSKPLVSQVPSILEKQINQTAQKRSSIIEYYIQKFKTIQDLNIFKKFTQINFGYKFSIQKRLNIFKKDDEEQEKKNLSMQQKTFIEQQVLKSMNILELLKDIIFIKKSIMILLTKDQLAAMKLVGYSENYIQDHYVKQEIGKQERKSTYFEQQLDILDSTDLSCKYIKKFIQKCSNNKTLDKIDQRILSSINKNQANQAN